VPTRSLALLLALTAAPVASAEPATDRLGDPLPAGAVARFGTHRLRHEGEVHSVAWSPDGKTIASGGSDGAVIVWDAVTGRELRRWQPRWSGVRCVAFSPDGTLLAAAAIEGNVLLWDPATGAERERLGAGYDSRALAFSPDGKTLVAAGQRSVAVWDVPGRKWREADFQVTEVRGLAFAPDGKSLAVSHKGGLDLFDPAGGEPLRTLAKDGPESVVFAPDGRYVAGVAGGRFLAWDAAAGGAMAGVPGTRGACCALSPDGKVIATGGDGNSVGFMDAATGLEVTVGYDGCRHEIRAMAYSPDGKRLATAGEDHRVRVYDTAAMKELAVGGRGEGALRISLSADGKTLAAAGHDGTPRSSTIDVWDTATQTLARRIEHKNIRFDGFAISPTGNTLAAFGAEDYQVRTAYAFDVTTGRQTARLGAAEGDWGPVVFAPDGKTFVRASGKSVVFRDAATLAETARFDGLDSGFAGASFSPDGRTLVTGGYDKVIRVWDVASGKPVRRFDGHGGYDVTGVAFAPDGRSFASTGGDGFVAVWDAATGKRLRRFAKPGPGSFPFVAYSPDGKLLASETGENTFVLWEADTGRLRAVVRGHRDHVSSAAFAPDGRTLYTGSADGTVLAWDVSAVRGEAPKLEVRPEPGLPAGATTRLGAIRFRIDSDYDTLALSPDNKTVAVSVNRRLTLRDAADGRELRVFSDQQHWFHGLAVSPDGTILAARSGRDVFFWNPSTGERLHQFVGHPDGVGKLAFSPDGTVLATAPDHFAREDRDVRLWDVATGAELLRLTGNRQSVEGIAFSADGKRLSLVAEGAGGEAGVCVWDIATGEMLRRWPFTGKFSALAPGGRTLATRPGDGEFHVIDVASGRRLWAREVRDAEFAFSPDGRTLAAAGRDASVRLYDSATGRELRRLDGVGAAGQVPVGFSPDGTVLATRSGLGESIKVIRFWDVATGRQLHPSDGHQNAVTRVAYSPDGTRVATGSSDGTVRIWEPKTGRELRRLGEGGGAVLAIAFAPDGSRVSAGDDEGNVRTWDAATGRELARFTDPGKHRDITSLAYAADGKTVVTRGSDNTARFWDAATGAAVRSFHGPDEWGMLVGLSPDGRLAVFSKAERGIQDLTGVVRICDVTTGRELHRIPGTKNDIILNTVFSPDGKFVAGRCSNLERYDGFMGKYRIRLLEAASGQEVLRVGADDEVGAMAFSPDGRFLLTGGGNPFVTVWDLSTGRQEGALVGHAARVLGLAFSPDGRFVASAGADHTALIWDAKFPTVRRGPPPEVGMSPDELWSALAGGDAANAFRATGVLSARPADGLALLRRRLRPAPALDAREADRLIADLGNDAFAVRDAAQKELARLGEAADPALRRALKADPAPDLRRRLEGLVARLDAAVPTPEQLRAIRATAVLERIGTAEARELLREWAAGAAGARLTHEAKASLERMSARR
jgi:WD40 repeat protein